MGRLEGKVAFITGAGSGIGRASAILFAENGARVAVADINEAGGAETVATIQSNGGEALMIPTDVTEPDSVCDAIARTVSTFGPLTVLYNNAGGSTIQDGPAPDAPLEEFWRAIKVDLFGAFLGCRFGIPELIKAGGGSVINTTSNVALMGVPGRDCYTAAKGGVAAITRSLAVRYAPDQIRVNAIAPGATRTARVEKLIEEDPTLNAQENDYLLGLSEPEHIANMALYLASDESAVTTGQIFSVDSGITIS